MITITHIDTACMLIDINGYRILTDPTLDNAGQLYYHGAGAFSRKTDTPAVSPDALEPIDLVLLSHHQHKDNFDQRGQALTAHVPLVLSTPSAARAFSGIQGLDNWESFSIVTPKVAGLTITATPAQHRPWWIPEFITGKVIGFVIRYDAQEDGVLYITGDTVYFKGIEEVGKRFKIDVGVFHVGAVQFRYLTGLGLYTMNSKQLIKAATVLQPNTIIPIHYRGWSHFKERESSLREHLQHEQNMYEKVMFLEPGKSTLLR